VSGARTPAVAPRAADPAEERHKLKLYATIVGGLLASDAFTKYLVQQQLRLHQPVEVLGDFFRLTYLYNPGAAFGLHLGAWSRAGFIVLTLVALVVLFLMYRSTPITDHLRLISISLVSGGAIGNLVDRIRSPRGVVDFLDFGFGNVRWPVFNVADMAVTTGAVLLAISLWKEETSTPADESG
jgi:lipoprotein signal peptidase